MFFSKIAILCHVTPFFDPLETVWKATSVRIEAGYERFTQGRKEHVTLAEWRVDLEKMMLAMHGQCF